MDDRALIETAVGASPDASPCRTCGACCSFAPDWPRFTLEDDADLQRIPGAFIAADLSGMRCDGNRCSALTGKVGVATLCSVYDVRPEVCRACQPGDDACRMARQHFGLSPLEA